MAKVKFTTNIDGEILKEIKIVAIEESRPVNLIIEEQLKNYLNKKEKISMKKEQLLSRIENMIDKKMLETGKMGTETVSIELKLTDEEKEVFHEIELEENYGYDLDGNNLYITYSEEVEGEDNMKKEVANMSLEELLKLDNEILSEEDLEELEEHELVTDFESLGGSGQYPGHTWFSVILENNEDIDVYCKFQNKEEKQ